MEKHPVCPRCGGRIVERMPWWEKPPQPGQDIMSLEWGYVILCENAHFDYEPIRPSDDEIRGRKNCILVGAR